MSSKIKTKLETKTVDSLGKVKSRSTTYVNPESTNANLSSFSRALNSLSTNQFQSVTRIDRQNITDATDDSQTEPQG